MPSQILSAIFEKLGVQADEADLARKIIKPTAIAENIDGLCPELLYNASETHLKLLGSTKNIAQATARNIY
jgi:hypothetical protein